MPNDAGARTSVPMSYVTVGGQFLVIPIGGGATGHAGSLAALASPDLSLRTSRSGWRGCRYRGRR